VDRLSGGRAGVSFAAGWQPEDFVLNPGNFATARADLLEHIETVRRLWNGEATAFPGPDGGTVAVQTHPRPVQDELPIWLTSAGSEATFRQAGDLGANVLTHLLGQSLEDVERLVGVYRRARRDAGHHGPGKVTLMLHTFVGETDEEVRSAVREPMIRYLRSSVGLIRDFASSFPAFRNRAQPVDAPGDLLSGLAEEELRDLLEHAFERYYRTSGLFGTPERCAKFLRAVRGVGVDEVACLVDFGLPAREVLGGLERLNRARGRFEGSGEQTSIAGLIREHGVTHFQCTPSMMSVLTGHGETLAALRRLRVTLVGGEAFPLPLAQRLSAELPGRLLNMYGPTETTIWSTVHEVREGESSVPIGRPIANTACYVLDEHGQPTPPGMIGELYIGGDGVARGYLNRPDLTAQRFLTDPFAAAPDARMYRTGDLARFRADGVLEFHGRIDGQVKIRGHRIELGEIETAIGQQPGVRDVVVVALDDQRGEATLAAYCSPSDGRQLDTAAIRAALARKLPQVMIPSFIVTMDTLPKTPNGKFDRKALPRPETVSEAPAIVERPAGVLEEEIAAIWREELGIPEVSRSASFFDLGGNSLLLVKVHRRLCEGRGARLSLADLFHYPTVAALAAHLADEPVITSAGVARAAARRSALTRRREPAPVGTTRG
jgi:natural product biosynthesis luciferase-like monooxygenase protein